MTPSLITPARPARQSLQAVAQVGLVGVGLAGVHLVTGWGIPCPFRALTGWLCPLCGATHAGEALLTGNWLLAWQANSMVLIAAALVAIRSLGWLVEIWRQPQAEPGRRWLPAAWSRQWLGIVIVIATVYAVIRNF